MIVKNDCKYFRGDIPCKPHKSKGVHCEDCDFFQPFDRKILIIKLGAAGDVIRTTPILRRLRKEFPQAKIFWLTDYPIFVPKKFVDEILKFNFENVLWLQQNKFDLSINLDKDKHAIALMKSIDAKLKKGYTIDEWGNCRPKDQDAEAKWLTGLFDDISRKNKKSYPEEIFEIFGYQFRKEEYILELPATDRIFDLPKNQKIIGLNTGCGERWLTRLWGEDNWIQLSNLLVKNGYYPLLLGGPHEDEMNNRIAENSQANYLGTFMLKDFLHLVNTCDLIVTSVTMAMHIAIALKKKLVLFNNIFNRNEFELYGLGKILEPKNKDCLGCYRNSCPKECMSTILPELVFDTILELLE